MFLVQQIVALVLIASFAQMIIDKSADPLALPMLETIFKVTLVRGLISPLILAKPIGHSIYILTDVLVAIMKKITAIALP